LLLCSFAGKAQVPFSRDYYLNESGTPVKVNAMVQDSVGYIWLGTDDGLYYYNGLVFIKVVDSVHKPVTALASVDDQVWAGYKNGRIGKVHSNFIDTVHICNRIPATAINCINVNR